jgi:CHAT domain-containing protein
MMRYITYWPPATGPRQSPIGWAYRLLLFAAVFVAAFQPLAARAQTIENWTDLGLCAVQLAWHSPETDAARDALQGAQRSGDMLAVGEALLLQVYPLAAKYCSASAADQFRESAVTQLLGGGASQQMSEQAQQFLRDLERRGLGRSPRAGRLLVLLALDAEAAGRVTDAFGYVRQALAIPTLGSPDGATLRLAEEMLRCLQKDVAAGTTSCGADEANAGPFAIAPGRSFCSYRSQMAAAMIGVMAMFGRPIPHAMDGFCADEARLRELLEANQGIAASRPAADQIVDTMLDMAGTIDGLSPGNAVARVQFRNLAAAYAEAAARAARVGGNSALADHLLYRGHVIADASAVLRRMAATQLRQGYKGWVPIEPWGAQLIALMLESHAPPDVFASEAFTVMAAAKFDSTSIELRAMAARRTLAAGADLDGVDAAKAALGPHEAMLAVRFTPAGTGIALLLRHDMVRLYPIMLDQAAAARLASTYRQNLISPRTDGSDFDPTEGALLYQAIFGPIDADNALDGIAELFVVPDRTIENIPVAALIIGVQGQSAPEGRTRMEPVSLRSFDAVQFLRDRLAITMLPSIEDLAALRHTPPARVAHPYAGLADPIGPAVGAPPAGRDGWPLLPLADTAAQVKAAQVRFGAQPGTVLIGADATLEGLLGVLDKGPFGVVEFATHALTGRPRDAPDSVPDPPWLLISPPGGEQQARGDLTGSFLTLREIAALKLDANLVILSACDTAGPAQIAGDGLLSGLSRAFIRAGARSLIVTYWNAPYPETPLIMQHVTAELAANPSLSAGRAIVDAMRDYALHATGVRRLPYFWASLGAVGPRPAAVATLP